MLYQLLQRLKNSKDILQANKYYEKICQKVWKKFMFKQISTLLDDSMITTFSMKDSLEIIPDYQNKCTSFETAKANAHAEISKLKVFLLRSAFILGIMEDSISRILVYLIKKFWQILGRTIQQQISGFDKSLTSLHSWKDEVEATFTHGPEDDMSLTASNDNQEEDISPKKGKLQGS